ncbi:hypothetical protein QJS66_11295 [Kocuria rhizophila]|nr:hypothetical protein QJS66_11295 [Kocuria rhizophila]
MIVAGSPRVGSCCARAAQHPPLPKIAENLDLLRELVPRRTWSP